jgi:hypothetical protein
MMLRAEGERLRARRKTLALRPQPSTLRDCPPPFAFGRLSATLIEHAGVAELADALDSKSSARKGVEVQVLSPVLAPKVEGQESRV